MSNAEVSVSRSLQLRLKFLHRNVVDDKLFLPLTCISEFNHANHTTSAVKAVKKLALQLLPSIDQARLQISVPIEGITFQGMNKLFYHEITISSGIVASLHKVSYILPRIPFAVELLKLWWLIV